MIQYLEKWQSDNEVWSANEYNLKNFFFEKSYTKYAGETSYRPFSKKLKLSTSLDQ